MEKVYFRDNEKVTILGVISIMANLDCNLKDKYQVNDNVKMEKLRKIFVETYFTTKSNSEAKLAVEIAEKCNEIGIDVDLEQLKRNYVIRGISELHGRQKLTKEQQNIIVKGKEVISNLFVHDFIYKYLEENLKKVITSEIFKRLFGITYNWDLTLKVSSKSLDKIFENEHIKNKENFFCQEVKIWAAYNHILPFVKCEIKKSEESPEKNDIFINISILKDLLEMKKSWE